MLQSYLGIASQHGLEVFCPEQPHTHQFLWRRARRMRGRVICFWTVMPTEIAQLVRVALQAGCTREALDLVQRHAHYFGSLWPSDEDSPPQWVSQVSR